MAGCEGGNGIDGGGRIRGEFGGIDKLCIGAPAQSRASVSVTRESTGLTTGAIESVVSTASWIKLNSPTPETSLVESFSRPPLFEPPEMIFANVACGSTKNPPCAKAMATSIVSLSVGPGSCALGDPVRESVPGGYREFLCFRDAPWSARTPPFARAGYNQIA